jgi:putative N6-adenine-specific DNA methylase
MCGSGTFALEAAMLAKQVPPGFQREFAFMHWPSFRSRQWQYLKAQALAAIRDCTRPMIYAMDIDANTCTALSQCVSSNGLDDAVTVRAGDFFHLEPAAVAQLAAPAEDLVLLTQGGLPD